MLLTLPLGAWAGYKAGTGEWDQKHKTLSSFPGDNQKIRRKATEDLAEELSKTFPELSGLQKISEDKELRSLYPKWGDGDEYPIFRFTLDWDRRGKNNYTPVFSWHLQYGFVGINPEKGWWCTEDNPGKKINNLKSYLLSNYTSELRNYKEAKKRDSYFMEPKDYDEVISWIECVIKKVRQYL